MNLNGKFFYKGDKPVYYEECAAHANVFETYGRRNGGITMGGPVCDSSHQVIKLMAKWVPLDEFEKEWKEVEK